MHKPFQFESKVSVVNSERYIYVLQPYAIRFTIIYEKITFVRICDTKELISAALLKGILLEITYISKRVKMPELSDMPSALLQFALNTKLVQFFCKQCYCRNVNLNLNFVMTAKKGGGGYEISMRMHIFGTQILLPTY